MGLADQPLTLCAGSMVRYSFAEFAEAAAEAGFAFITVTKRLAYLARTRENLSPADMRAMLGDQGLRVAEVEGTPGWLRASAPRDERVLGLEEALRLATQLNATGVTAYHDGRATESPEKVIEDFGVACDQAFEQGLTFALEFLPWSPVPSLDAALTLVERAHRPNGRVVLDSWHHAHSALSPPALSRARASLISCVQLSDARQAEAGADLAMETRFGRRVPGTGILDLPALVAALDTAGVPCPVGVEVYDATLISLSARDYATTLGNATRRVLARGPGSGGVPACTDIE